MAENTDKPPAPEGTDDGTDNKAQNRHAMLVLGLVAGGHMLANFYMLSLAPLVPFMKEDFGVSYALLGTMLSIRAICAGILQIPVGFMVDRFGGKKLLTVGLVVMTVGFSGIAFVPNFWWALPLAGLYGVGLSTVRPSHYTIINASIPVTWLGRAFGVNMFVGHMGRAAAPPLMVTAAVLWGWREALMIAGGIGIAMTVAIVSQWRNVRDDSAPRRKKDKGGPGFITELRVLASRSVLVFVIFYIMNSLVNNGLNAFTIAALDELHGTPLTVASSALTGYLLGSAVGVLAGGWLVDKTRRSELVAMLALLCAAAMLIVIGGASLPLVAVVAVMSSVGVFQGILRPARDLMLRAALPRESFGKAVAMVTSGGNLGGVVAPVVFGAIMDSGAPEWVFYATAGALIVNALLVLVPTARTGDTKSEPGQR